MANEITNETNIWDLIEQADFQSVTKNQSRNFEHYIEFLNKNGIDHIYKNGNNPSSVPLDESIAKLDLLDPVSPISGCTTEEMVARFESYYPVANNKQAAKEKELREKIDEKNRIIKRQKAHLNRKSVRAALTVANMIAK